MITLPTGSGAGFAGGTRRRGLIFFVCALIAVVAAIILTYQIDEPFWGRHDFNSVFHSIGARNFLKYGLLATDFMPATNTGDVPDGRFDLYLHHPPGTAYCLAAFYGLLGETEWAGRTFFALCAVGSAILLFLIGRLYLTDRMAAVSALVFSLFPCVGYYGRMINFESPSLFFSLLTFLGYCLFLRKRTKMWLLMMYAANFLALWTGWQAYPMSLAIALHYLFRGREPGEPRWKVLLLPFTTLVGFGLFLNHVLSITGNPDKANFGDSLLWTVGLRFGSRIGPETVFTLANFVNGELFYCRKLFTPIIAAAAGIWLVIFLVELIRGNRKRDHSDWILLTLLVYPTVYVFTFKQQAYLHDYILYHLSPWFALAGVCAIGYLFEKCLAPKRWVMFAATGLVTYSFLAAASSEFMEMHKNPQHERWGELGKYLRKHTDSDEALVFSFPDGNFYVEYYSDREILRSVTTVEGFQEALKEARNHVVVYLDLAEPEASPDLLEYLRSRYVEMPIDVGGTDYTAYVIDIPRKYRREAAARVAARGVLVSDASSDSSPQSD